MAKMILLVITFSIHARISLSASVQREISTNESTAKNSAYSFAFTQSSHSTPKNTYYENGTENHITISGLNNVPSYVRTVKPIHSHSPTTTRRIPNTTTKRNSSKYTIKTSKTTAHITHGTATTHKPMHKSTKRTTKKNNAKKNMKPIIKSASRTTPYIIKIITTTATPELDRTDKNYHNKTTILTTPNLASTTSSTLQVSNFTSTTSEVTTAPNVVTTVTEQILNSTLPSELQTFATEKTAHTDIITSIITQEVTKQTDSSTIPNIIKISPGVSAPNVTVISTHEETNQNTTTTPPKLIETSNTIVMKDEIQTTTTKIMPGETIIANYTHFPTDTETTSMTSPLGETIESRITYTTVPDASNKTTITMTTLEETTIMSNTPKLTTIPNVVIEEGKTVPMASHLTEATTPKVIETNALVLTNETNFVQKHKLSF